MSTTPEGKDIANVLRKFESIKEGKQAVNADEERNKRLARNDMFSIVESMYRVSNIDEPLAPLTPETSTVDTLYQKYAQSVSEEIAQEDSVLTRDPVSDFFRDITAEPESGPDLGPCIKTYTMPNGKTIKIHGNEDSGFKLMINNKIHSATFESYDHAASACESFVNRSKS